MKEINFAQWRIPSQYCRPTLRPYFSLLFLLLFVGHLLAAPLVFEVGAPEEVPNTQGVPVYTYSPEGHFSILKESDGTISAYWPVGDSYRTNGQWPLENMGVAPSRPVMTRGTTVQPDNGGCWLFSVFRQQGNNLIGFYHFEDWYIPGTYYAYKHIGRATSTDNGYTWTKHGDIITSARPKPDSGTWGGVGDFCVIWDFFNKRWIAYHHDWGGPIRMTMSEDPEGKVGTWQKWYNGSFSQPGIGGLCSPVPGLDKIQGGNPSVHWNYYLNKWIITYHGWGTGPLIISSSTDLINWEAPQILVDHAGNDKIWYPTLLSPESDVAVGQEATLIYNRWPDANVENWNTNHFMRRVIRFSGGTSITPYKGPITFKNEFKEIYDLNGRFRKFDPLSQPLAPGKYFLHLYK